MAYSVRAHSLILAGYSLVVLALAAIFSFDSSRHPNPYEFATPLQSFWFGMFVWGVLLLLGSGVVVALSSLPVAAIRMRGPVAFAVGAAAGLGVFLIAGFGLAKRIAQAADIPPPWEVAIPGTVVGLAMLAVAGTLISLTQRDTGALS